MDDRPRFKPGSVTDLIAEGSNVRFGHECGCTPYLCPQCNPVRNYEDVAFKHPGNVVYLSERRGK